MSETFDRIKSLVRRGAVLVSRHGFRELAADDIALGDVVDGIGNAVAIEDYPDTGRGPSVLVLTHDRMGSPIHVVWGTPDKEIEPAVLVTAYRPDSVRWSADFTRRRKP